MIFNKIKLNSRIINKNLLIYKIKNYNSNKMLTLIKNNCKILELNKKILHLKWKIFN